MLESRIDFIAQGYVGTDICPCQFLSPQAEAEGIYLIFIFGNYMESKRENLIIALGFSMGTQKWAWT